MGGKPSTPEGSIHDYTVEDAKGNFVNLSTYKGKILLIVNVASKCYLTASSYEQLNDIYFKYRDRGLEILAFPCNQFFGKEPGTSEEIECTACSQFNAEFPIFGKIKVNGNQAAPLYKFLKSCKPGWCSGRIKWNFTKFLVDRDGHVVQRYSPNAAISCVKNDLEQLLSYESD
ncbi:hypothetical protein H6P81_006160 [Aristolochia fimbriata]|uniref:Glutathione peroxidase n=1 Tax=Aristolochia fimbriata TaxID=158543 RepID=A0AAV7F095_ARIFI|nr:hypothetical protein H6P81_006160 [Aristolochia fimbriata]